ACPRHLVQARHGACSWRHSRSAMKMNLSSCSRREFLACAGQAGLAVSTVLSLGGTVFVVQAAKRKEEFEYPKGKAEHCVFIWLGGGAAHIDTWDPKRMGDAKKVAGSA